MEDKQMRSSEHRLTSEESKTLVNLSIKPSKKVSVADNATVFQLDLTAEQKPGADQEADVGLSIGMRDDNDGDNNTDTKTKHKKSKFLSCFGSKTDSTSTLGMEDNDYNVNVKFSLGVKSEDTLKDDCTPLVMKQGACPGAENPCLPICNDICSQTMVETVDVDEDKSEISKAGSVDESSEMTTHVITDTDPNLTVQTSKDVTVLTKESATEMVDENDGIWVGSYYDDEIESLRKRFDEIEQEINDNNSSVHKNIDMQSSYIFEDDNSKETTIKWNLQKQLEIAVIGKDIDIETVI